MFVSWKGCQMTGKARRRRDPRPDRAGTALTTDWAVLLASCTAELVARQIVIPEPFDLDEFATLLAQQRGRPLHLIPTAQPVDASDLTATSVVAPEADYIFYADSGSALHRSHIVLHEIGHLIFGTVHSAWNLEWLGDPPLIQAEREAEAVATLILGRWVDPEPQRWASTSPLRLGADRLVSVLGWR